ncbi:MAG: 50S ribosomal protein L18e [Candidatus Aenigmarchaeota archaeon]|nr:50S ribosomal protein L18e [Candidatus Aenigmarchaeota archaeon]
MPKPTGPTNPIMKKLIEDIKSQGYKENVPFLLEMAKRLEKSKRSKPEVNLSQLERVCKENETVVVPGKVLSSGILKKTLNVAAASFSMAAVEKITNAGGKTISIKELIKNNPKGTNVRIVV